MYSRSPPAIWTDHASWVVIGVLVIAVGAAPRVASRAPVLDVRVVVAVVVKGRVVHFQLINRADEGTAEQALSRVGKRVADEGERDKKVGRRIDWIAHGHAKG